MNSSEIVYDSITADCGHQIGVLTLNRPDVLNALNENMIIRLATQLKACSENEKIALIILRSNLAKAFCAGGDVKKIHEFVLQQPDVYPNLNVFDLISKEYRLDYFLHHYPKPIICWGDGIVMGGGMGLLQGSRYRIVTERSHLAMPEINIGLYPDVGASYFLSHLPDRIGMFLGMTGTHIQATDAVHYGLADYATDSGSYPELLRLITHNHWSSHASTNSLQLDTLLQAHVKAYPCTQTHSSLRDCHTQLAGLLNTDFTEAYDNLCALQNHPHPFLNQAGQQLANGSPSSALLAWIMQICCQSMNLKETFKLELTVTINRCHQHDFLEGVRARLIEKNQPQWQPADRQTITLEHIHFLFDSPWKEHPFSQL